MFVRRLAFAAATVALVSSLALSSTAEAQRCVDPGDRTDLPLDHRYCGADLITGVGGPAGFGDPMTSPTSDGCLHLNDDMSGPSLDMRPFFPRGLRFFSMTHNSLYVNTNGNITFSAPLGTYTPAAFPVAARPMIAPFWADVDTRASSGSCTVTTSGVCVPNTEDQVWWHFEPGRAFFTWDEVSYFSCQRDRRMSFQMILSASDGCGGPAGGDFDVEFRYNRCEWDTGGASGGSGGFLTGAPGPGRQAAQAGFDAGDTTNYVEIMTSRETRTIIRTLCEDSNVGIPGVWRFQLRGGTVICPDAGDACTVRDMMGAPLMGACAEGRTACEGSGTVCVQQIMPRAEICDNIDNDCNGIVDDGMDRDLCFSAMQSCVSGVCVDNCFEGSCSDGLTCTTENLCVDPECDGITCAEGERCSMGRCVPACEGIVCPAPTSCVAGRCVDVCLGLTCDDCTACDNGTCVARCTATSCGPGEECAPDGRCISAGCTGVMCGRGTVCRAGACVDACLDAICPPGDVCMAGECVRRERPDAGPLPDAPREDAGTPPGIDAPVAMDGSVLPGVDAPIDAGRAVPPQPRSCGCSVPSRSGGAPLLFAVGLGLFLALRRRS